MDTFYFSETVSQNWRAAAAMIVSVPPTFPGFIYSVKGRANTGAGAHLFDISFVFGVSIYLLEELTRVYTWVTVLCSITCLFDILQALPVSRNRS